MAQRLAVESISVNGGMEMDIQQAIECFSVWSRMNLGWRDVVADQARGLLYVRIGSSRSIRKMIIRLNAMDLYDIEIGRMNRRTFEWVVEAQRSGVFCDELANAAIEMHGEVAG